VIEHQNTRTDRAIGKINVLGESPGNFDHETTVWALFTTPELYTEERSRQNVCVHSLIIGRPGSMSAMGMLRQLCPGALPARVAFSSEARSKGTLKALVAWLPTAISATNNLTILWDKLGRIIKVHLSL